MDTTERIRTAVAALAELKARNDAARRMAIAAVITYESSTLARRVTIPA